VQPFRKLSVIPKPPLYPKFLDCIKKFVGGEQLTSEFLCDLTIARFSQLDPHIFTGQNKKHLSSKDVAVSAFQPAVEELLRTWIAEHNSSFHVKEKIILSCLCAIKGLHFKPAAKWAVKEYMTACGRIINASYTPNKQQQVSGVNALW
jgi:hypothetical protein